MNKLTVAIFLVIGLVIYFVGRFNGVDAVRFIGMVVLLPAAYCGTIISYGKKQLPNFGMNRVNVAVFFGVGLFIFFVGCLTGMETVRLIGMAIILIASGGVWMITYGKNDKKP